MVTLTIDNSACHIHGLPEKHFNKLRELMSYRVPHMGVVNYSDPRSKRCLLTKRGDFGTGLLPLALHFMRTNKILFTVKDIRTVPKPSPGMFTLNLENK